MGCNNSSHTNEVTSINIKHKYDFEVLVQHYQPPEFPIEPVLNKDTQKLIRQSWDKISKNTYDSNDALFGKVSGVTFFYNTFFEQLFIRYQEFENIFRDIKTRANIISKVLAFCVSIDIEQLHIAKTKLKFLGKIHQHIVHQPFLFSIYATNLHNTIKICLGDDATADVMNAWMHTIAWVLKHMLPSYMEMHKDGYFGIHTGATNATSLISDRHRQEVKDITKQKIIKSREKSRQNDKSPHYYGYDVPSKTVQTVQMMINNESSTLSSQNILTTQTTQPTQTDPNIIVSTTPLLNNH